VKPEEPRPREAPAEAIGLCPSQLATVFPFHVAVDRSLRVLQCGPVLRRLCPELEPGRLLGDSFRVVRPHVALEFERMAEQRHTLFVLEALHGGWRLRGQVVVQGEVLLVLGSPWVTDMGQLMGLGLSLGDYAPLDPLVDYLFLLQELNTALADARRFGTDQRQKLQRSQSEFRHLIEHLPEGVALHRQGLCVYANPAFCAALGYGGPQELVGRPLAELLHLEEPGVLQASGDVTPVARECRVARREGGVAILEVMAVPVTGFEGGAATLVVARNLTEQKHLQAKLMQADRMVTLGTLAAGVAHEINNPLAYLLSNLRFLQERLQERASREELSEELEALAETREGAERVQHIVRDMLALSRNEETGQGPADVHRVIESSLKLVWSQVKPRARVVKALQPVPPVACSEARLGQVVLNLLLNAVQAMPEGKAEENELRVSTRTDGAGRVLLEVRDTGVGMTPQQQARLFEPFFTTKPAGMGTGLGLFICQAIVASLGGEIQVESRPGQGSLFRVVLPGPSESGGP
jgi:PAS domain S-box-containing protein